MELLPDLYIDLAWEDPETKYIWLPNTVNIPEQGMVYADCKTTEEWKWSSVKAKLIPEEDRKKYPIPGKEEEYYKYKMDTSTLQKFEERDFMEALDYIGAFKQ